MEREIIFGPPHHNESYEGYIGKYVNVTVGRRNETGRLLRIEDGVAVIDNYLTRMYNKDGDEFWGIEKKAFEIRLFGNKFDFITETTREKIENVSKNLNRQLQSKQDPVDQKSE